MGPSPLENQASRQAASLLVGYFFTGFRVSVLNRYRELRHKCLWERFRPLGNATSRVILRTLLRSAARLSTYPMKNDSFPPDCR